MEGLTQINDVLEHLIKEGSITSWEAIQKYHATRLSAIIYILRKKRGYDIITEKNIYIDKKGRKRSYGRYVLLDKNPHIPIID